MFYKIPISTFFKSYKVCVLSIALSWNENHFVNLGEITQIKFNKTYKILVVSLY